MSDVIREAFETVCVPNFGLLSLGTAKKANGEYLNDTLEDHWQTFQEGWESAISFLKNKSDPGYSDILSDGGYDPRS